MIKRINWSMLIIPLVIGIPFLYIGLYEINQTGLMLHTSSFAEGKVVGNSWTAFAQGGAAYVPMVEFKDNSGVIHRFTDGIGTIPPEFEIGESVKVVYDPNQPQTARLYTWKRIWFAPTLITAIGSLPIVIGVALAFIFRNKNPKENS